MSMSLKMAAAAAAASTGGLSEPDSAQLSETIEFFIDLDECPYSISLCKATLLYQLVNHEFPDSGECYNVLGPEVKDAFRCHAVKAGTERGISYTEEQLEAKIKKPYELWMTHIRYARRVLRLAASKRFSNTIITNVGELRSFLRKILLTGDLQCFLDNSERLP